MNRDQADIRPLPPTITGLMDEVSRGVLPVQHLSMMRAVVETVPGPSRDWRALLVTESLEAVHKAWELKPTEGVVLVGDNISSKERRRYQRKGWTPITRQTLMEEAVGPHRYRRCLHLSTPKMRQASMIEFLRNQKAGRNLLWPALNILDSFYSSAELLPDESHMLAKGSRDLEALTVVKAFWDLQVSDPLGSKLGMPKEAMAKLWRHEGGAWPSMPPNLAPKFIAVAETESLHPAEVDALSHLPVALTFFGDPAIGSGFPLVENLNRYPLGNRTLADCNSSVLSLGDGLTRAIHHAQRNDHEISDEWVQSVASLSGVALGGHRREFDVFRELLGKERLATRRPPTTHDQSLQVISRYGVAGLRQQLNALQGKAEPCLIEGSAAWKGYLSQAMDVVTVIMSPMDAWPDKLRNRFKKGADAALYSWSHSPEKKALVALIHELRHPGLLAEIQTLSEVPYKATRIVMPGELARYDDSDSSKLAKISKGNFDALGSNLPLGGAITIHDDALEGSAPSDRGQYLYRQISQQPITITHQSQEALRFIEQACGWLHEQTRRDVLKVDASLARVVESKQATTAGANTEMDVSDAYWAEHEPDVEQYSSEFYRDNAFDKASEPMTVGTSYEEIPLETTTQNEPIETQAGPDADSPPLSTYSDSMLEAAAAHEAALMGEDVEYLHYNAFADYQVAEERKPISSSYNYSNAHTDLAETVSETETPPIHTSMLSPSGGESNSFTSEGDTWRAFLTEVRDRQHEKPPTPSRIKPPSPGF